MISLFLACACPRFEDMDVVKADPNVSDEALATIAATLAEFALWTQAEGGGTWDGSEWTLAPGPASPEGRIDLGDGRALVKAEHRSFGSYLLLEDGSDWQIAGDPCDAAVTRDLGDDDAGVGGRVLIPKRDFFPEDADGDGDADESLWNLELLRR